MVGLLVLAADGHEAQLAQELEQFIELDQLPDLGALTQLLAPPEGEIPHESPRAIQSWRHITKCRVNRHFITCVSCCSSPLNAQAPVNSALQRVSF